MTFRLASYLTQAFAVTDGELRKIRRDPSELITRAFQPVIWLLLFGEVMANVRGLAQSGRSYIDFMAPGILAQSVLFSAIFYGISVIWERDLGILHRQMVSPAPRSALVLGRAIASGFRSMASAVIIYILALVLKINLSLNLFSILGTFAFIWIGAALFATFSLIIACIVKTRDRFMGIGQILTMPIFFASNAIYPIDIMPPWLQWISSLNPLTYEVDALRTLMIADGVSRYGLMTDAAILVITAGVCIAISARMYPHLTE